MSQFFIEPPGGSPAIPTQFTTDDGTGVASENDLNILGQSTTDNNSHGIATYAIPDGSDNLYIMLTNRFSLSGNIPSGPTFAIITFPLSTSGQTSYRFRFDIIVRVTSATAPAAVGDTMGYTLYSTFKTNGSVSTIVGNTFIDSDEDINVQSAQIDMVAVGNNAILQYTPAAGNTVAYNVVGYYIQT